MSNKRNVLKYKLTRLVEDDIWGLYLKNPKRTKIKTFLVNLFNERTLRNKTKQESFIYRLDQQENIKRKKRRSLFFKKLMNKQKFKKYYGNISDNQLRNYINEIVKSKAKLLDSFANVFEMRLDSILFRANFAQSIRGASVLIKHGFVLVNNQKITHQSYRVSEGDCIEIVDSKKALVFNNLKTALEKKLIVTNHPSYLHVDYNLMAFYVIKKPIYKEVPFLRTFDVVNLINYFN